MGQIVAMINEDADIAALCGRINQRKQFAEKRIRDFQKQLQEAQKDLSTSNTADWEILTTWLQNKGRLPASYNKQTHNISFNIKNNGIQVDCINDEPDMSNFPEGMQLPEGMKMVMIPMDELPIAVKASLLSFIESQMKKDE